MEHEMSSINPKPAAKVLAVTLLLLGIIAGLVISLLAWLSPGIVSQPSLRSLLLQPLLFALVGYVGIRLFCAIYNRVADRWGGIRFDLKEIHSPLNPKWKP